MADEAGLACLIGVTLLGAGLGPSGGPVWLVCSITRAIYSCKRNGHYGSITHVHQHQESPPLQMQSC